MDPTSNDKLYRECIGKQLEEVDMLSSIYCNPGEMHIYDPGVISDFNEYLNGTASRLRAHLDYAITIATTKENAIVTIHSALLSKLQDTLIRSDIDNFIASMDKTDTYVFQVISWIQEQIDNFLSKDTTELKREAKENQLAEVVAFERLWIYSHHIKSRIKRQEIVRLSRELNLSGFSRPGKPGIICVEGLKENTQEFWRTIKSMQWHKITIRKSEVEQESREKFDTLRRFVGFREELFFESGDEEGKKINMSQFMNFLENHKFGYIKKDLFGFD